MCDGFTPINEIDPKGAAMWSDMGYELTPHPAMSLSPPPPDTTQDTLAAFSRSYSYIMNYRIKAFILWWYGPIRYSLDLLSLDLSG